MRAKEEEYWFWSCSLAIYAPQKATKAFLHICHTCFLLFAIIAINPYIDLCFFAFPPLLAWKSQIYEVPCVASNPLINASDPLWPPLTLSKSIIQHIPPKQPLQASKGSRLHIFLHKKLQNSWYVNHVHTSNDHQTTHNIFLIYFDLQRKAIVITSHLLATKITS